MQIVVLPVPQKYVPESTGTITERRHLSFPSPLIPTDHFPDKESGEQEEVPQTSLQHQHPTILANREEKQLGIGFEIETLYWPTHKIFEDGQNSTLFM